MIAVRRDDIVVCTCALWPCGVRSRRPARPVADAPGIGLSLFAFWCTPARRNRYSVTVSLYIPLSVMR